ncbi:2279_t:CDS:2 [Ambispora gerdemannii]|uniref:2279_t:CDS:1 n=1 Tax=Ambispora gerdemannii TaxID=144530 RepID=A0A9N9BM01_9GLOM|nr:2279_t:CDS:2 [Ambispora gerdemannii]
MYKSNTPDSVIDKHVTDFEAQATKNKLYKGIMVTVPENTFNTFSTQNDEHIDTVEVDGVVKTQ